MTDEALQAIREEYRRDDRSRMGEVLAEVSRLRAMLVRLEWEHDGNGVRWCPNCEAAKEDGHEDDCELAALLRD